MASLSLSSQLCPGLQHRSRSRTIRATTHSRKVLRPLNVASGKPQGSPAKDPFAEKTVYRDGPVDLTFIKLYSQKMAAQLINVRVPVIPQYDDFVRISKEIMKGRSPEQQGVLVRNVLMSLLPPGAPEQFRKLFPPTKFSAEFNARIASLGFFWLVGESELQEGPVQVGPNEVRVQKSIVKIKKCRYLEASGCVGMCANMCKNPTQDFFTNDFGLPLTMKPNFEDLSCEMIFGQAPPPPELDDVYKQPCFRPQCNMGSEGSAPCPKLKAPA
eukprot:CAMPEP_0202905838 /NCGR_PEP_ID=MMETSP1392-20130828/36247_1 /ASSEMBLY_ACC=CAM_ASM_000868 /TAXON_ID=225041 /ORGANISM="Chlamydomonas chlamydogama, Strain SAG 11-48b" /LENGTH=270 /DNA_ID=CAMNT_0049594119 /DNA_START=48 /DNA_END=860 /DNA_ORIENTATION=-